MTTHRAHRVTSIISIYAYLNLRSLPQIFHQQAVTALVWRPSQEASLIWLCLTSEASQFNCHVLIMTHDKRGALSKLGDDDSHTSLYHLISSESPLYHRLLRLLLTSTNFPIPLGHLQHLSDHEHTTLYLMNSIIIIIVIIITIRIVFTVSSSRSSDTWCLSLLHAATSPHLS